MLLLLASPQSPCSPGKSPTPFALLAALAWPWLGASSGAAKSRRRAARRQAADLGQCACSPPRSGRPAEPSPWTGSAIAGLEEALKRVGPHPRVLAITESLGLGHPLVRDVGGVWVQRVPSNWIVAGAQRLIAESHGDPKTIARLQPFIDADRDRLVEDIEREKPDAILVGKVGHAVQ